jgi:hypothetical protein
MKSFFLRYAINRKISGAKKSQIARLCADASFKMSRWSEAIRFMEMYRSQNKGKWIGEMLIS